MVIYIPRFLALRELVVLNPSLESTGDDSTVARCLLAIYRISHRLIEAAIVG